MKRMLVNATQSEEVRVALVDGQRLYDLDIDNSVKEQNKGNIYKAKVTRVEPSLEAAFVEYGGERHGFLPMKDVVRPNLDSADGDQGRPSIQDVLREGQELIVQVEKEERGTKGAALTTFVSLAGRYLVLMPNNPRVGGISRRIDGDDRSNLRESLSQLDLPEGMGLIVRTAGIERSPEELQWDLDYLLQLHQAITRAAETSPAPTLLYQDNTVIVRAIRDCLRKDIGEVLIDGKEAFEEAQRFIEQVMPHYKEHVKFYTDDIPLFNRYQIEHQIESAFEHEVHLPSGGSIVIDPTEALVSIDINSARATKGGDIEETALTTNLEAAEEIARQLRLRDVGGLIVIDFIDMMVSKNQRTVENKMRELVGADRARIQIGKISRFGLMEMSRQRLRSSLQELTTEVCPRCVGQGRIRDVKSLSLVVLRIVEEECMKERSSIVRALVPVNVAAYLLNEKRPEVAEVERRTGTHVVIVPSVNLETPHYEIQRIRDDSVEEAAAPSYSLVQAAQDTEIPTEDDGAKTMRAKSATVRATDLMPRTPPPTSTEFNEKKARDDRPRNSSGRGSRQAQSRQAQKKPASLLRRILNAIVGQEEEAPQQRRRRDSRQGGRRGGGGGERRNDNRQGSSRRRDGDGGQRRRGDQRGERRGASQGQGQGQGQGRGQGRGASQGQDRGQSQGERRGGRRGGGRGGDGSSARGQSRQERDQNASSSNREAGGKAREAQTGARETQPIVQDASSGGHETQANAQDASSPGRDTSTTTQETRVPAQEATTTPSFDAEHERKQEGRAGQGYLRRVRRTKPGDHQEGTPPDAGGQHGPAASGEQPSPAERAPEPSGIVPGTLDEPRVTAAGAGSESGDVAGSKRMPRRDRSALNPEPANRPPAPPRTAPTAPTPSSPAAQASTPDTQAERPAPVAAEATAVPSQTPSSDQEQSSQGRASNDPRERRRQAQPSQAPENGGD